jgi:hypothetical protein
MSLERYDTSVDLFLALGKLQRLIPVTNDAQVLSALSHACNLLLLQIETQIMKLRAEGR